MSAVNAVARRTPTLLVGVGRWLEALPVVAGLGVLVALQVAQAFWFAFSTPHNGWIWYSGGDATSYWTEQWAVGHLQIPQAVVGYGLPVYYAWVPLVAGPSLLTGAAVIVLFQMIVLVPLALVLFWGVADRLFGRVYAWFAAALWVLGPALLLLGFVQKYHWVFDQLFLVPHWFGLTNMGDLPSLVAVLGCVLLTLRAVDLGSSTDAVLAGLVGGLALGIKPSNGFFVPAIAFLLLGSRRLRLTAIVAASAVPAVLTLTLWKVKGLGNLPLTSAYTQMHLAAGSTVVASSTSRYLPLDWHHFSEELRNLHEVFWSVRFLEFLIVAGAFGLIRKSSLRGLFVLVWFVSYGVVKAASSGADFPSATYYRLAEPGLPAFILLVVGVAFCVPAWGRRRAEPATRPVEAPIQWRRVAPAAILLGAVPLLLVGILQNPSKMHIARDENVVQEAPLSGDLHPAAHHAADGSTTISWRAADTGSSRPWYAIYYAPTKNSIVSNDNGCSRPDHGANECFLNTALRLGYTQSTTFTDRAPTPGRWYRVAVLTGYQKSVPGGDLMLVSNAVGGPSS
jgi:hypothetical protein